MLVMLQTNPDQTKCKFHLKTNSLSIQATKLDKSNKNVIKPSKKPKPMTEFKFLKNDSCFKFRSNSIKVCFSTNRNEIHTFKQCFDREVAGKRYSNSARRNYFYKKMIINKTQFYSTERERERDPPRNIQYMHQSRIGDAMLTYNHKLLVQE